MINTHRSRSSRGFTLIEIILAISLLAIIFSTLAPVYNYFFTRNNLDLASQQLVQNLRRAQTLARGMENDSNWGVYVTSSSTTIFSGAAYASRNTANDETGNLGGNIFASGTTEIIFQKLSGKPLTTATIILKSPDNENKNVIINSQGTISY